MEGFKTLRVLHLEDDPLDVELASATLEDTDVGCEVTQVHTREDIEAALEENSFDLVLADYSLPAFDGLSALKITQEARPEAPFVLGSGTVGEDKVRGPQERRHELRAEAAVGEAGLWYLQT